MSTTCTSIWAVLTRIIGMNMSVHAYTLSWLKLIVEIWCTIWTEIDIALTLIAISARTFRTSVVGIVLNMPTPTSCLTESSTEIEVVVGWVTSPSHHVEYCRLTPAEATPVFDNPWPQHINSKCLFAINSLIYKLPLILEATGSISNLEGSNSHDEVINKFYGNC